MDSIFFRILFVVVVLLGGMGILVYSIMWIMVPVNPAHNAQTMPNPMTKRFLLSLTDRKIAGVCGGLGEFFQIDPVIFRIIFVVLMFLGGVGILLYLILWLVAPRRGSE